jgi:hypothetical protein
MGLGVDDDCFYTSAMATASFLKVQRPDGCSAVISVFTIEAVKEKHIFRGQALKEIETSISEMDWEQ